MNAKINWIRKSQQEPHLKIVTQLAFCYSGNDPPGMLTVIYSFALCPVAVHFKNKSRAAHFTDLLLHRGHIWIDERQMGSHTHTA